MVSPKTPVRNMIKVNLESMDSPLLVSELAFACETKKRRNLWKEGRPWFALVPSDFLEKRPT